MSAEIKEWAQALAWIAGLLEQAPRQNAHKMEEIEMALQGARKLLRTMPDFPSNDEA